ncbi:MULTISPECIES: glutaredoxin family protein [unclassified Lysobacter]|uniref:glutaredoxin family protein n=1 Tax=unclassified Lysobacter TaxID=2635362 RepID=UPI001BECDE91|nr:MULTISPECIES: glutaredoxin family protein [unclassified Lysobacter]MBT2747642.1 glutaredoxin family protein [Lysobacter sp. ISL-42]MBT2752301.1 glutaredoxin family protein [Lysobacter sp. ISL-50]MBT2777440.1 glutaredoxin family protein [Lysobacter sp. ISL-54]MBT2784414.1 glutaredoxin family protein [Lysobacter sp. ISL-52]
MRVSTVLCILAALFVGAAGAKFAKSGGWSQWISDRPAQLAPDDPRHSTGDKRIVMLAAEWCGYCEKLRKDFELADVRYTLIDVDTAAGQKAMNAVGARGVPVTIVGQDIVYGYNRDEIKDRLEPLGYRL